MAKSHRPSPPIRRPVDKAAPAAQPAPTVEQLRARTRKSPDDAKAWMQLGHMLSRARELEGALHAAEKATELMPEDPQSWVLLAQVETQRSNDAVARKHFEHALSLDDAISGAHHGLADIYWRMNNSHAGLRHIERALELNPGYLPAIWTKAQLLVGTFRFEEAIVLHEELARRDPQARYSHLTNLASTKRDLGLLSESEATYREAIRLSPPGNSSAFSNWLTLLHYLPEKSAEDILTACKQWATYYPPNKDAQRPVPADRSPGRKLRIGLFSDGFRQHPVGAMTTTALEQLGRHGIELYLYTTTSTVDHITQRLQAIAARWTPITQVGDDALAEMFREDGIDILVDLAGYNAGTHMRTMTLEPAPILMKWVGGLINTTGLETIDYLITDSVESPPGSDHLYTEKLIRMPDDYICYVPPPKLPEVGPLPARQNGYVTFGCFNNPTKINDIILGRWAELMQEVPNSRLFLKGAGYGTESMRKRIEAFMARYGIDADRLRLEGQSPHYQLFERYNDVDVALDPWPYSGGLTTCEALLMGVPVVTLPGPTFAGRHSATHLANVGMPELVVNDWDEYRTRALGLVTDLDSLATIRQHLRRILLESPVCDAERFGRHLATVFRATWQRYCEGKAPAALAFTPDGKPWFEDEDQPMEVAQPDSDTLPAETVKDKSFQFGLQGKIVALDHGATLFQSPVFQVPNNANALSIVVIDPASKLRDAARLKFEKVLHHHHAHVALGDGEPGVLYTCLASDLSGTLEPLAPGKQQPFMQQAASLLAKLPIGTVRLDRIDGLDALDWLVLNETHDNKKILQGAEGLLPNMLIVHVRILFVDVFKKQSDLGSITRLLDKAGFRLLRLDNQRMGSLFADATLRNTHGKVASQLLSYDAIFLPTEERIRAMDDNQRAKLAFILHTAYRSPDAAHLVLQATGAPTAARYITAQLPKPPLQLPVDPRPELKRRKFVHVGINNLHLQPFLALLANEELDQDYLHQVLIERAQSMPGFDNDLSVNPNAAFFDAKTDLPVLMKHALAEDVEAVIFHGLFHPWQQQLAARISARKKTIWIMWGGDLYNPIRQKQLITPAVEKLSAVCYLSANDYTTYGEYYPTKPGIPFTYTVGSDLESTELPAQKSKVIFVGNSGDASNCHAEILDILATKKDIADYRLVLPVAYNGAPEYLAKLKQHIHKLGLTDRTTLLTELMPTAKYHARLAEAEFCIMGHHRQQGLGNLMAAMYFGAKIVLREQIELDGKTIPNPTWGKVTRDFAAQPVSFDAFKAHTTLAEIPFPDANCLAAQREKLLASVSKASMIKTLKEGFQQMAKL